MGICPLSTILPTFQCVLNAHLITMQMWPRCICVAAQAHLSGWDCSMLLALGLWEVEMVLWEEGASTSHWSLYCHSSSKSCSTLDERGILRNTKQLLSLPAWAQNYLSFQLFIPYSSATRRFYQMAYRTERLGPPLKQAEKGCHHTKVTVFMQ